jgi:hypothetical protein
MVAKFDKSLVKLIYKRDNAICQLCHLPAGEGDWDIDHIIPVSFGGQNYPANLRLTHKTCNNERADDLTDVEKSSLLSEQYDLQNDKCYFCKEDMKFSHANKVAPNYRFPMSWTNFALAHRTCRVQYNTTIVQEWKAHMKYLKGTCIRKILEIE